MDMQNAQSTGPTRQWANFMVNSLSSQWPSWTMASMWSERWSWRIKERRKLVMVCSFKISSKIDRVLVEHIDKTFLKLSFLSLSSLCSIRIRPNFWVIFEKIILFKSDSTPIHKMARSRHTFWPDLVCIICQSLSRNSKRYLRLVSRSLLGWRRSDRSHHCSWHGNCTFGPDHSR